MGKRGGRTSGTMPSGTSWKNGKTKTIRVPIKLVPEIIKIARYLDNGIDPVEQKIIEFKLLKQRQYQRTRKVFNRSTLRWSVFNEFQLWLKNCQSR